MKIIYAPEFPEQLSVYPDETRWRLVEIARRLSEVLQHLASTAPHNDIRIWFARDRALRCILDPVTETTFVSFVFN